MDDKAYHVFKGLKKDIKAIFYYPGVPFRAIITFVWKRLFSPNVMLMAYYSLPGNNIKASNKIWTWIESTSKYRDNIQICTKEKSFK